MHDSVIVVTVAGEVAEVVTDRLWQWGVRAVGETDVGNGLVELSTSVGTDRDAIDRAVATLDAAWPYEVRDVDASVGRVAPEYLSPTWYAPGMVSVPASIHPIELGDDDAGVMVTVIEPGSAFGLGDHPTTRASMALLATCIKQADPACVRMLDVGCGSGALAVMAAQLGVTSVRAIDIADAAVEATQLTADLNGVSGCVAVDTTPVADLGGEFDIVVANILAPTLISMAGDLKRLLRPDGSLIISGILADRHDHVLSALVPLRPADQITIDGWITIELR